MHLCDILLQFFDFRLRIATKFLTDLHLVKYKFLVLILYLPQLFGNENEFFSSNPTPEKVTFSDLVSDYDEISGSP